MKKVRILALIVIVGILCTDALAMAADWEEAYHAGIMADTLRENNNRSDPITRKAFYLGFIDVFEKNNYQLRKEPIAPGVVLIVKKTYDEWMEFFYGEGIINGKCTEQVDYAEHDTLNREELATIMTRVINYASNNNPLSIKKGTPDYDDALDISEWAYDSVMALRRTNIMSNSNDNNFYPKQECSIEETAAVLYRLSCFGNEIGLDNLRTQLVSGDGVSVDTFSGYYAKVGGEDTSSVYQYDVNDRYVLQINKHTNVATLICRLDGRAETITADNFDEIIAKNVNEHSITETYHMIYSASAVHDMMPTTGPVSDSYIVFYVYTDKAEMVKENVEFEFSLNGSSENIVAEIRQEKDCLRFRVSGWSGRQSNYDLNVRMTDKKTGKTETIQCNNLYIACPV